MVRRVLVQAVATVAVLALAGCAPGSRGTAPPDPDAPPTAPSPTATPPSAPSPESSPASTGPRTRAEAGRALLRAAAEDDVAAARAAIAAGADLETRGESRRTPLIVATKANHPRVARVLLEAGADPDAKDDIQDSAFLYAGAEGYDEILRETLRHGANVRSTNRYGGTALMPASEHGHTTTVRILIDAGVPLDHVNRLGWTAMLEAVVLGDGSARQIDVVRQLLGAGADPSVRDRDGRTPRDLAASRGYAGLVALLDDAAGVRDRGQRLVRAARAGDLRQVDRLLDRRASVSARDATGATALTAAAYGNHVAVARALLAAGADPNVADDSVQSAYLISTSEVGDDPRLLELLLAHGADVRRLDSWKGTGLIRAADRGFDRIVGVLLRTDIAIDHVNRIGYTALHEAVVLGDGGPAHQRTVAALVRGGVDTSIRDARGRTAVESARERGYPELVALLD